MRAITFILKSSWPHRKADRTRALAKARQMASQKASE
jgi:hypothetical protein